MPAGGNTFIDLTGKTFGRLEVVSRGGYGNHKDIRWLCRCECGKLKEISGISLREGRSRSCGCWAIEKRTTSLGEACKTPEYIVWNSIKGRCYNKENKSYKYYGGRGIKVCDRWLESFENFLSDMGRRPTSKHSLDRFPNNDGDYGPSNCRWATWVEQNGNKSDNRWFEYNGKKMICSDWAKVFGVTTQSVFWYVKHHSFEEAYYRYNKKNSRNFFSMNIN